jgi:hypothetical protein
LGARQAAQDSQLLALASDTKLGVIGGWSIVEHNTATPFSEDHASATRRFRSAAAQLGWTLETRPVGCQGPSGEELAFEVARCGDDAPERVLVVSSGLHGVEGFFGSAVQIALLERWAAAGPPPLKCVLLHGLNPFGFAWLRRFNEENIDPNRNFLLPGEAFAGAPTGYDRLDPLLNPPRPPSRWDPFALRAIWQIARQGLPALRQAIAGGQYEYPRGLFFGGSGPSRTQQLLSAQMPLWLQGSRAVVHLDFHTGLGRFAARKLLLDYAPSETQRRWLNEWFGSDAYEACDSSGISYEARGGFGRWCIAQQLAEHYLFACAEFGTYGPLQVLSGLRAENQAHHWDRPDSAATRRAKQRLRELFCPQSRRWRTKVVADAIEWVDRAVAGLQQVRIA